MERADPATRKRLSYDLIQGLIETATGVAANVDEGIADLADMRRRIQALAEAEGCTLGITGTHPYADPHDTVFVDNDAYRWVRSQLRFVASRNITFGMHVHVGVDDAERAIYVANRLRRWIGPLIALAANSPYVDNVDSGWDSARSFTFGAFPRSGVPPLLEDYAHYERVMSGLTSVASIEKARHIWWNVRVHPMYGTVEVRACDVQRSLRRTAAIVALCQALVVAYSDRHRAGEPMPRQELTYIEDARFKGARFGLDAEVMDPETGEATPMREQVRRMLELGGDAAARLGTEGHLRTVAEIAERGNEASAQRELAVEVGGDLQRLQLELLRRAREEIATKPSGT